MIVFTAGDKGGLGKSIVARTVADLLLREAPPLLTLDADRRNAHLFNMFDGHAAGAKRIFLDSHEGWMDLVDTVQDHPHHNVVVDLPGGIGGTFITEFPLFAPLLRNELGHEIALLWVLDRQEDSINLLRLANPVLDGNVDRLAAIRNNLWGPAEKFTRWEASATVRPAFEAMGGVTIDFPELSERTHDRIMKLKVPPFSKLLADPQSQDVRMTDQHELTRWLAQTDGIFETFLGLPHVAPAIAATA